MNDLKQLGIPFIIIFISALVTKFITTSMVGSISDTTLKIIVVITLCLFGATLNGALRKRSRCVWKKVVAVLVVIFLLFMQLNLFTFTSVANVFNTLGINVLYINMLYIFCGYMFVD